MSRLLFFVFLAAAGLRAAEFYVSPVAAGDGDGSADQPWTLKQALAGPKSVQPGDTIWLRSGIYQGTFTSTLNGAPGSPIIVRQYPGERVIIDGGSSSDAVLTVNGAWTWFWGFEVMDSDTHRVLNSAGSWNPDNSRGTGVNIYGKHIKCINLVVHDTSGGFGFWSGTDDSELYGNIIYNNGWDAPDRGHGHGVYTQNDTTTKRLTGNVIFNQFGYGIHAFGTSNAPLNNFDIEGNVSFQNGAAARSTGYTMNILLGGGSVAQSPRIIENYTYFNSAANKGENNLGYSGGCTDLTARGNYFAGGVALRLVNCPPDNVAGNTFYGSVVGLATANTNQVLANRPSANKIFIRPNRYEPGRATVVVFNWENRRTVDVDLSQVLQPGDQFEVLDSENYFGLPVVRGVYQQGTVTLPMHLKRIAQPIGDAPVILDPTAPEFAVFIVQRPVNPSSAPAVVAGLPQAVPLGKSVVLNAFTTGPSKYTLQWTQLSGPADANVESPDHATTNVTLPVPGLYEFSLTASADGISAADTVQVFVYGPAPTFNSSFRPIRVNAGGAVYTDLQGLVWGEDNSFKGGSMFNTTNTVPFTAAPMIYQSERWSASPFSYSFQVPNGNYRLRLRFAEVWYTQPGDRVYHVDVNGKRALENLDIIVAAGGPRRAFDAEIPVTVTGGQITIDFTPVTAEAKVNGIEILPEN